MTLMMLTPFCGFFFLAVQSGGTPLYYSKDFHNEVSGAPPLPTLPPVAKDNLVPHPRGFGNPLPNEVGAEDGPYEEQHALCSLQTDSGQLAARATVTRRMIGACQAKEVAEQLSLLESRVLRAVRGLHREVVRLRRAPTVFKYI